MIILWDSSTMTVEMSLIQGSQQTDYTWEADRTLARDMLAYIRDRLAEHNATFDDITGIGVFRGPGSFTGLRIGLTVLNTIASDKKIPIVGVIDADWRSACVKRLNSSENDQLVMPEYGGDAHITAPRK